MHCTNKCQCMVHMKTGLSVQVAVGTNNAANVLQKWEISLPPCILLLICLRKPRWPTLRDRQDGSAGRRGVLFIFPCVLLTRLNKSLTNVDTGIPYVRELTTGCKSQPRGWLPASPPDTQGDWPVGADICQVWWRTEVKKWPWCRSTWQYSSDGVSLLVASAGLKLGASLFPCFIAVTWQLLLQRSQLMEA